MFADGLLGVRRIWWLLQCSHLMVPLCIVVCPVGARCGAALCPVTLLLAFLPISGSFFFCWHTHSCWCAVPGGQQARPTSHCGYRVVPLAVGWYQGHRALLHMSPNLQTDLSLVFVGVVLGGMWRIVALLLSGLLRVSPFEDVTLGCPRLGARDSCESTPWLVVCSDHQWFGRHKRAQGPCTRPWRQNLATRGQYMF